VSKTVWDGMTEKQFRRIVKYLGYLRNDLGLQDWCLVLSREFCSESGNEDAAATITFVPDSQRGTIRLAKDFMAFSLRDRRRFLIHELLHCHQDPMTIVAYDILPELLGLPAWTVYESQLKSACELMVDNLSYVVGNILDDSSYIKYLEPK
jgi:hypothetical protein